MELAVGKEGDPSIASRSFSTSCACFFLKRKDTAG